MSTAKTPRPQSGTNPFFLSIDVLGVLCVFAVHHSPYTHLHLALVVAREHDIAAGAKVKVPPVFDHPLVHGLADVDRLDAA